MEINEAGFSARAGVVFVLELSGCRTGFTPGADPAPGSGSRRGDGLLLVFGRKGQHIHRTHIDADATLNASGVRIVEGLRVLGEGHHVDADLTVFRALSA